MDPLVDVDAPRVNPSLESESRILVLPLQAGWQVLHGFRIRKQRRTADRPGPLLLRLRPDAQLGDGLGRSLPEILMERIPCLDQTFQILPYLGS